MNMKLFFVDIKNEFFRTYEELIKDINSTDEIRKYINCKNPYDVFLQFICCIIHGIDFTLIDYDMSKNELENIGINSNRFTEKIAIKPINISSLEQLLSLIEYQKNNISVTLYTSGTTGRPKKIEHTIASLARTTKTDKKYSNKIWGFAYNPTHFAGIQVFLQAFFNRNVIVNLFKQDKKEIQQILKKYNVTNISATPTFYRMILSSFTEVNNMVECLTFGGEKYDVELEKHIRKIFPKAKLVNIYASTETGTLFRAYDDKFIVDEDIRPYVRIMEDGELLIHKKMLGKSSEILLDDQWYHTGDIVQFIGGNVFRFISRKTEMINVGGYKVNPHEVESFISEIPGIIDVLVYGRKNRITGNILAADIVIDSGFDKELIEIEVEKSLKCKLQEWKIPRIVKFVDHIDLTRSGKKVRK